MKFGIMFANTGQAAIDGSVAADLARSAEKSGFESIWTVEHVVVPSGYASTYPYDESGKMGGGQEDFDITDPLVWLSYVAAATESIRLATGILILPQRNPVVLAKAVATLDRLSGGRMMLGVGVGWLEEEFDALGVPFARRGARTDDSIRALRSLWSEDCSTYDGDFVAFRNVYSRPQPETGSVPIVVGGHSDAAARRAGRLGDGFFPGKGDLEELERLIGIMRQAATEAGRDPDAIELTTGGGAPEHIMRLANLGFSRVTTAPMAPEDLVRYGEEVISRFA